MLETVHTPEPSSKKAAFATNRGSYSFASKDAIIVPLLSSIKIADPSSFTMLAMPCTDGPELTWALSQGVPRENIYTIERDRKVWQAQKDMGLSVTGRPEELLPSIQRHALMEGEFDLVYLDPWCGACDPITDSLYFLFRDEVIKNGGTLILNLCTSRASYSGIRTDQISKDYLELYEDRAFCGRYSRSQLLVSETYQSTKHRYNTTAIKLWTNEEKTSQ